MDTVTLITGYLGNPADLSLPKPQSSGCSLSKSPIGIDTTPPTIPHYYIGVKQDAMVGYEWFGEDAYVFTCNFPHVDIPSIL